MILGDFVDFLQVDPPGPHDIGDTSSKSTVEKLNHIERGHEGTFAALGRFVAKGHSLEIVLGNHDIEFCWLEVQTRFRELIVYHAGKNVASVNVVFHPWIFYVPGVVYAEHGHQYDEENSFAKQLLPVLPGREDRIELPLGSFFVLDLFNKIERHDPFADNVKPPTRYITWALLNHPSQAIRALLLYRKFYSRVMEKTKEPDEDEENRAREEYRRSYVRRYAEESLGSLRPETVEEIDRRSKAPTVRSKQEQRRKLWSPGLILAVLLIGILVIYSVLSLLAPTAQLLGVLVLAIGVLLLLDLGRRRSASTPKNYLLEAAQQIHDLLDQDGSPVPAYVFGHTHNAEQHLLKSTNKGTVAHYFNTGTWTPLVSHPFDLLTTRELFTFVQITHDPNSPGRVLPQLLLWNDTAGRAELLTRLALSRSDNSAANLSPPGTINKK